MDLVAKTRNSTSDYSYMDSYQELNYMVDIVLDPDALSKSRIHPIIVERARKKLLKSSDSLGPKAKRKWQEIVILEDLGIRLAMICHKEEDKIVIRGIRKLGKPKPVGPPRRRL